jgi:hypothetical protein
LRRAFQVLTEQVCKERYKNIHTIKKTEQGQAESRRTGAREKIMSEARAKNNE